NRPSPGCARVAFLADALDLLNHDVLGRYVLEWTDVAGGNRSDLLDHVQPLRDLSEYRVAPSLQGFRAVIQERVIGGVDEELRGGGVRVARAGHRDGAGQIF